VIPLHVLRPRVRFNRPLRIDGPRVAFALATAAVLAYEAYVMFAPTSRIVAAGTDRYIVKEFGAGEPVGQTFRALEDGLESAAVQISADRPASVDVVCRLMGWAAYKEPDHWVTLFEWKVTREVEAGVEWHRFAFKPVPGSTNAIYQFQVQLLDVRPQDGAAGRPPEIGLMASTDDSLREGNILIGHPQLIERDLVFDARTANEFTRYRARANPLLPEPLRSAALQLGVIALYNCALAIFAFYMTVGDGSQSAVVSRAAPTGPPRRA
jgi:hypothetical protein